MKYSKKLSFEPLENRVLPAVTAGDAVSYPADTAELTPALASAVEIPAGTDPLKLHSCEGAPYTIYLDFDGHTVTGTSWNKTHGSVITIPRFNLDGDSSKTAFSAEEEEAIYSIWLEAAEDYIPFNVDVTTEDPGSSVLSSAGAVRVCIGGDSNWYTTSLDTVGVAKYGSFDWNSDTPCFVFSENLDSVIHDIAVTASHEVGHTLNLRHDGKEEDGTVYSYYEGAGGWGPIMGDPYGPLVQWSCGEYEGATNSEDDLQVLADYLSYRTDDYGSTRTKAEHLTLCGGTVSLEGIIEQNTDYDYFSFSAEAKTYSIDLSVIESVSNLNSALYVYNSAGKLTASSDSSSQMCSSLNFTAEAGTYYVCVTGIGKGIPIEGVYADGDYSDYASLGSYRLTIREASAGIVVTTEKDTVDAQDGVLSLREAAALAGNNGLILFDPSLSGKTILLSGSALTISSAVTIDASSLADGITISGNSQSRIFTVTGSGNLTLTNLTLTNGYAENGGAICNNGGKVTLTQSTLQNNKSYGSDTGGGAVCNLDSGSVTITDCRFESNSAENTGGAVYNENSRLVISGSVFTGNTAKNGAALDIEYCGTAEITDSVFSANISLGSGGAVRIGQFASLKAVNSLFAKNQSQISRGGAIAVNWSNGTAELRSCTVTQNSARNTGGIFVYGTLKLYNTIVAENTAEEFSDISVGDYGNTYAYNTLSPFTEWTSSEKCLTYNPALPLFTDSGSGDFSLAEGSQAIDQGNNNFILGYDTDLTENTRIVNGVTDLGAYEYQPLPVITGLSFTGWSGIYDGNPHSVILTGSDAAADRVTYICNGQTTAVPPSFTDPGTYSVTVTVSREGYTSWTRTAEVRIQYDQTAVETRLTFSTSLPAVTESDDPESISAAEIGSTVYASVWVRSSDPAYGVEGGYCSLYFSEGGIPGTYTPSPLFNSSIAVSIDGGHITGFGGYSESAGTAYGTETWVLAGTYSFTAAKAGTLTFRTDVATKNGAEETAQNFILQNGENTNSYNTVTLEVSGKPLDTPAITTGDRALFVSYGANRHLLQWNAVENAAGYELSYSQDGQTWNSVMTTDTSAVVTGLTYGTEMYYRIRALGSETGYTDSGWSAVKTFFVCPMDINNDGDISGPDRSQLINSWLTEEGDSNYRHYADIDADGDISGTDRSFLSQNWLCTVGEDEIVYPTPLKADLVFDNFIALGNILVVCRGNFKQTN